MRCFLQLPYSLSPSCSAGIFIECFGLAQANPARPRIIISTAASGERQNKGGKND